MQGRLQQLLQSDYMHKLRPNLSNKILIKLPMCLILPDEQLRRQFHLPTLSLNLQYLQRSVSQQLFVVCFYKVYVE